MSIKKQLTRAEFRMAQGDELCPAHRRQKAPASARWDRLDPPPMSLADSTRKPRAFPLMGKNIKNTTGTRHYKKAFTPCGVNVNEKMKGAIIRQNNFAKNLGQTSGGGRMDYVRSREAGVAPSRRNKK